ncbi:MAG: peptidoglycan-binding domain-containing protein [Chthoniobacterales bacterium]
MPRRLPRFGVTKFATGGVTGELNEETLRSVNSSPNSVAGAARPNSKPAVSQPTSDRPEVERTGDSNLAAAVIQPTRWPAESQFVLLGELLSISAVSGKPRQHCGSPVPTNEPWILWRRVDGKYGRQMAFAVQAFQSSARLAATGRLDAETLEALGSSDAHFAYLPPASCGYETWMPMKKFKKGKWKVKWKRHHRPVGGEDRDDDRQANRQSAWNP